MKNLKVIPVIDILNGITVHAVKGKRSEYKPLESGLVKSADPVKVAEAFKTQGFDELYIADLDAIIDCREDFSLLERIAETTGLKLLVDAGITSLERAERLFEKSIAKIIVGTETLQNSKFCQEAVKRFGSDRVVVSLDLKDGKVLTKAGFNGASEPLALLYEFKTMGVSQVIVLDLSRVGSGEGVDTDFLKKALTEMNLQLYVGGGVRNLEDLRELQRIGISGVLVATALHTEKISITDLKQNGFL